MAEREGTPEDFARMLRGEDTPKQEANRRLVESLHPAEGAKPEEDAEAEQEFMERLFAPKPGHADLIRLLHPPEDE